MIAVDSNLLIYAHRSATPEHRAARHAIELLTEQADGWGFSIGNVLEFWSVVTHPDATGRPSTPGEARSFFSDLIGNGGASLWYPADGFETRLFDAAAKHKISGPRVFDLQIAMTALDNGAREIWTHDRAFIKLPGLLVRDPLDRD